MVEDNLDCICCEHPAMDNETRCAFHTFHNSAPPKTRKQLKAEAIRKHNEAFEHDKANPKSTTEIVREALLDVVGSIK